MRQELKKEEMARYSIQHFEIDFNEALSTGDTYAISRLIRLGGLCILPSDTCYAVAADPMKRGVPALVNAMLGRNSSSGISLSFGSQLMMERYVTLDYRDFHALDGSSRQKPITLVARINPNVDERLKSALPAALSSDPGFLGVRLSFSAVERQMSNEYGQPLTTVAIYYEDGTPMRSFDDAITFVVARLEQMGSLVPVAAIKHPVVKSGGVSTVVGFVKPTREHHGMTVYREGATAVTDLERLVGRTTMRDVEDWT